jgi:hypothetical protein
MVHPKDFVLLLYSALENGFVMQVSITFHITLS